ncbi:MAG: dihydroneopterin aldolase [Clostridia bacterium]|nr:dihydroneopterin aldolase [Clostridia bacterium]
MDKVTLKNMKFYAYHGVLQKEKDQGQYFFIDVDMFMDLKEAGNTDDLTDTVDYSAVYEIVKSITINYKFSLIEKLAGEISREILSRYQKICEIIVRVRKPDAPIGGELDYAQVEMKRCRGEL